MSETTVLVLIYVIAMTISIYIGLTLRKKIDKRKEAKLVKELELVLGQELPMYKKEKNSQVNWDRVYNLLKKETKTDYILKLREEVEKQARLYHAKRTRASRWTRR